MPGLSTRCSFRDSLSDDLFVGLPQRKASQRENARRIVAALHRRLTLEACLPGTAGRLDRSRRYSAEANTKIAGPFVRPHTFI